MVHHMVGWDAAGRQAGSSEPHRGAATHAGQALRQSRLHAFNKGLREQMADHSGSKIASQATIEEMVSRIVSQFDPDKIILFGSHARHSAGPDSDVDLLIVMTVNGSKRKIAVQIYRLLAGIGLPKDIVIVTPDELARYHDLVGTVVRPAVRDGKVLYERRA